MGIFAKLFGSKADDKKVGGMEDYMTLVSVYFQAALASQLGITNLAMLPELRVFKTSFHVPTVNNRLGIGEKAHVRKMMHDIYGTDESWFKEIDSSIRKNCQKLQDVNVYLKQFQAEKTLKVRTLQRGFAWLDTGTHDSLSEASTFIECIEKRQGLKVACLEEIAYKQGWIGKEQLRELAKPMLKNGYGKYLMDLVEGK
jgi:hypothetical protein